MARVAKVSLHPWEEPAIAGPETGKGAGTVFFSGCNLRCVFCQNYEISHYEKGREVTDDLKRYLRKEQYMKEMFTIEKEPVS